MKFLAVAFLGVAAACTFAVLTISSSDSFLSYRFLVPHLAFLWKAHLVWVLVLVFGKWAFGTLSDTARRQSNSRASNVSFLEYHIFRSGELLTFENSTAVLYSHGDMTDFLHPVIEL